MTVDSSTVRNGQSHYIMSVEPLDEADSNTCGCVYYILEETKVRMRFLP